MKTLSIYPTTRAIRQALEIHKSSSGFIPNLISMGDFIKQAIVIPHKSLVDPIQRAFYLKEAIKFEAFEKLKIDRDILKFYTKSDDIFKFLEELSHESVGFDALKNADSYAEFEEHIGILEQVSSNYQEILAKHNLSDRFLIPSFYEINLGFVSNYSSFELHLEGYLSHFEMELIAKIAQSKAFVIHFTTTKFTHKVQERFETFGITLPNNSHLSFDMQSKSILSQSPIKKQIEAKIYKVEERLEQLPIAFESIQKMVDEGIEPNRIALILPDESFKETLFSYDKAKNLNFAMGFDYTKSFAYKKLNALLRYLSTLEERYKDLLLRYAIDLPKVLLLNTTETLGIELFFERLHSQKLIDKNSDVLEKIEYLKELFKVEKATFKEWLAIYLKVISKLTSDDIRGGKITVMGALETRGVSFDGVVIIDFNDDIVPMLPSKDRFLNSTVRRFASLPTRSDREALQKYFYERLLQRAQKCVIIHPISQNRLISKFAYELGLESIESVTPNLALLHQNHAMPQPEEIVVCEFNPYSLAWSATMLKSFLGCKRQFYYKYILKIRDKFNEEFNEGLMLHQLLDRLMDNQRENIDTKLTQLLDELLGNSAKASIQKMIYRQKIESFLAYQEKHHFAKGYTIEFKEKNIDGAISGLRFKGVVDRLDSKGDEAMVIDYKSGSTANANRSKNLEKLDDFQMSIYAFLLKGKYTKLELAFFKILENNPIEHIKELDAKNELLLEHIEAIKNTTEFVASKCKDLGKCIYCPYRLMCERGEYIGR